MTNPMDLTEKDALQICVAMWEYLENHPFKDKREAIRELGLPMMAYGCAACEYAILARDASGNRCQDRCKFCPMWKDGLKCTDTGQAFDNWRLGNIKGRSEAARAIKELALQRLEELKNV